MTWLKFKHGTLENQHNVTTILAPYSTFTHYMTLRLFNVEGPQCNPLLKLLINYMLCWEVGSS